MDIFNGLHKNTIYLGVFVFTVGMQIIIVQFGGEFTSTHALSLTQWIYCAGIASISLPLGTVAPEGVPPALTSYSYKALCCDKSR